MGGLAKVTQCAADAIASGEAVATRLTDGRNRTLGAHTAAA
jgi:hypothetical protein